MSAATLTSEAIPEKFLSGERRYEIIDGDYVEMEPMSTKATGVRDDLAFAINAFTKPRDLGKAYSEMLIKLDLKHGRIRVRRPDIAYVSFEQWPKVKMLPSNNGWEIRPELCVEVVSPTDRADELLTKLEEYFESGVRAVWVVHPEQALVYVYESFDSVKVYRRDSVLPGGSVLPGFTLELATTLPEATDFNSPDEL